MAGLQAIIFGMINLRSPVAALAAGSLLFWAALAATAFAPIGFVSNSPQLLVANPKVPYRSVQELVAWAKSNPGRLNFATAGVGTLPHLTYELFKMETGIQALNVPYAGGAPALTAVIAGQADVLFDLVRTRVKSGEVRALAITGTSRDADQPGIRSEEHTSELQSLAYLV